jgi:NAD(P)-dependent dehydrogenase (short-subunit alcohol dehydrogenase family)
MDKPTVLISGASRGLGAATARIAAELGAQVALMARSAADLQRVAEEIEAHGGQALSLVGDVSNAADCRQAVDLVIERFGRLDALVNNAGVLSPIAPIADAEADAWERNLAVNVMGPFLLTQAALPYLRPQQGRVINVSSGAAVSVIHGWGAYCVAKAALNHFTRVLAAEEPQITTIAFGPGLIDTAMQELIRSEGATGMPEEVHAQFVRHLTDGDLLPPEVPGCALAVLAFYAPQEWSGAFMPRSDERVLSLVRQFASTPCAGWKDDER